MGNLISLSNDRRPLRYYFFDPPNEILPKGVSRTVISTPEGDLELLIAKPSGSEDSKKTPLLLQHGGFGCAEVYKEFLSYFAAQGRPCYALSVRGRGHSWRPSWWRLTFSTSPDDLANDVAAAIRHVSSLHDGQNPVLVAHSNGGALAQLALDKGMAKVSGLVLMCSRMNYGSGDINKNWLQTDPWFPLRLLFDGFHPRSPLSSTTLVHKIFFQPEFPRERVRAFEELMADTESYPWASVANVFDTRSVLLASGAKLLVLNAERDVLMRPYEMKRMADDYSAALGGLVKDKKVDPATGAVRHIMIARSGHHLQNDLQWEEAAKAIDDWVLNMELD